MSNLLLPNTTQVPDFIIDVVMPLLPGSTFKVLLAVVRKTYGFQKGSDKLSLTTFQKLTGLSRSAVNEAIKDIGPLLKVIPGQKNTFGLEAVNEYALSLESSGIWVEWYENRTSVKKRLKKRTSSKIRLVQKSYSSIPIREDIQRASSTDAADSDKLNPVEPEINAGSPKKRKSSASPGQPGVKLALDTYHDLFFARFGAKPDIDGGRDGGILSKLIKAHGSDEVQTLLKRFFESPPAWVEKNSSFTITTFKGTYTQLLAQSRNGKAEMKSFG